MVLLIYKVRHMGPLTISEPENFQAIRGRMVQVRSGRRRESFSEHGREKRITSLSTRALSFDKWEFYLRLSALHTYQFMILFHYEKTSG